MPIPHVHKNESKKAFTSRCMSDAVMQAEFPKQPQRYAVCLSQWKRKGKK